MIETAPCRCCAAGLPTRGVRVCPECGHIFRGHGWDGIDAHWRANHETIEKYEVFFAGLCEGHRWTRAPIVATSGSNLKNEAKTITRFLAGKTIRATYRSNRGELVVELTDGSRLIVEQVGDGLRVSLQD